MPSSRPIPIPYVVDILRQIKPTSILDVGVGFGKYGHIFREYTDIVAAEKETRRYDRENWQCQIDGIEVFAKYLTSMHEYLYNQIHIGDAITVISNMNTASYDLVWMGDVIEHLTKERGLELIAEAMRISRHCVALSTPSRFVEQSALLGNEHERHLSFWNSSDLHSFGKVACSDLPDDVRLIILCHPHQQLPAISLRRTSLKTQLYRLRKRLLG